MTNVYDHVGSLRRMGEDVQLFQEMVGLLKSDAPPLVETGRRALSAGDWPRLERAAHTLKGLAANFGATRAVAAAAELERLAKKQPPRGAESALAELELALEELIAVLPKDMAGSHAS
jgi:HPt (histidine-containing phosphotransfer) domain-containing protein